MDQRGWTCQGRSERATVSRFRSGCRRGSNGLREYEQHECVHASELCRRARGKGVNRAWARPCSALLCCFALCALTCREPALRTQGCAGGRNDGNRCGDFSRVQRYSLPLAARQSRDGEWRCWTQAPAQLFAYQQPHAGTSAGGAWRGQLLPRRCGPPACPASA